MNLTFVVTVSHTPYQCNMHSNDFPEYKFFSLLLQNPFLKMSLYNCEPPLQTDTLLLP